jgi:lysophospholipase L1-like esterase
VRIFLFHIALILSAHSPLYVNAQAYIDEINAFKKQDSIAYAYAGKHPIVFAGSSSFRLWKNIDTAFSGYPVLNRGFGGSTLTDLIRYANDVIIKYSPKQVVIYCGENDLASADSVSAEIVLQRFKELFRIIREKLPNEFITYISIKPSPSRINIQPKVIEANRLIKIFLNSKDRTSFVDVYTPMLNADGSMRSELFIEDKLHMNAKGYEIWQKLIQPYLLR